MRARTAVHNAPRRRPGHFVRRRRARATQTQNSAWSLGARVSRDLARAWGVPRGHVPREGVLAPVRVGVGHDHPTPRARRARHATLALGARPDGADLDAVGGIDVL